MTESVQFQPIALKLLIPLVLEFISRRKNEHDLDLHGMASKAGQAFGIDDVDAFAVHQFQQAMQDGLGLAFDADTSEAIASVFSRFCQPVMLLVVGFARGEIPSESLLNDLMDLCDQGSEGLREILVGSLGLPEEAAGYVSEKLSLPLISVYCFAAAGKLYLRAAQDAALAKERRIEAEKLALEAIAHLKEERAHMGECVSAYLLDRLVPVREGIAAMDLAMRSNDDEAFIAANAELWKVFGRESQFSTVDEFEDLMMSDDAFML